ncbi:MAG: NADH-quinone oxidoreductase subunit C [Parcubacteria group bacterium]|jgi:Ni,Fe-hydrogenase III large subunit/Ni,Fe-hydrogenase III component G
MSIKEIIKSFCEATVVSEDVDLVRIAVSREDFASSSTHVVQEHHARLASLFATDDRQVDDTYGVHAIFSMRDVRQWLMISTRIPAHDPRYPALTRTIMAAHWYERYMRDMFGIEPVGHPDLRRLVHHENVPENTHPLRKDFAWNTKMEKAHVPYPMHHVEGEGVFEIPVGPIHAGIIEPGHFRFNVAGERILTLEGKLFFTHKGVEKLVENKHPIDALPFIERISGDMSAAHALAYAEAIEKIGRCIVPQRAQILRAIITECERITMHVHDLANIGGMGTGYSFIAANGFRIKERMMRLSEEMCGNRFWRGVVTIGGTAKDWNREELDHSVVVSDEVLQEITQIFSLALNSEGFLDRLQYTGELPYEAAIAFGAVGLPARASRVDYDVRRDHPYASYETFPVTVITKKSSDVFARYRMRALEIKQSVALIKTLVSAIGEGPVMVQCDPQNGFAIGAVESWRGEIVCAVRMKNGVIDRCFPRDPSFCNWALFGIMGPGNIVPDFPLINKSLNLSYSGTDL